MAIIEAPGRWRGDDGHVGFHDVGTFHQKFELENTTFNDPGPRRVTEELLHFRMKFLQEELEEFNKAASEGDHEKMFDSLIDLVYVAYGTAHLLGYPWAEGWAEVQRANMEKQRAERPEQSARGSTWDVIKPAGWKPPDIKGILRRYGWRL